MSEQRDDGERLRVRRLNAAAALPTRAHEGDAGFDLSACERHELAPGGRAVVGTGVALELQHGWAALVCPRSGLAARHGISVVNAPGVIDSGYRGEVRVVLHNTDASTPFTVNPGDRIAQLVLVPVFTGPVVEEQELSVSSRNDRGFGSTGISGLEL